MTPAWKARAKQRTSVLTTRERTTSHDGRTSIEEAACSSPQPPDPRGNGGAQAGGYNPFNRAIAIYSAQQAAGVAQYQAYQNSLVAFQGNSYLNQLGAQNSQSHNPYSGGLLASAGLGNAVLGNLFSVAPGGVVNIPIGHALSSFMTVPTTPQSPLPVEIRPGEIVAWRCWVKRPDGLYSMVQNNVRWEEGVPLEASKGDIANGVGIHAWKTRAQAENYAGPPGNWGTDEIVMGTIELWGEVIEHEEGYRAQFGQIKEIVETRQASVGNPYRTAPIVTMRIPSPDQDSRSMGLRIFMSLFLGSAGGTMLLAGIGGPIAWLIFVASVLPLTSAMD